MAHREGNHLMDSTIEAALLARRQEVIAEISELSEQLSLATARAEAAESNHADEKSRYDELTAGAASGLRSDEPMASGTHAWLRGEAREPLREAEGERGATRAMVESLKQRIASKRGDVDQLDRSLEAAKVVDIRPPNAVTPRRKPAPVDYDNIQSRGVP
jgi:hypothetical protein